MSLGDRPYLDFPFPYAPLTFVTQAVIIRLFGTVYWHHIAYAAIVAGFATFLTWRILASIFRDSFVRAGALSFVLAVPLAILGVYCIFPHPFYDPDAAFVILLSILLLLRLERHDFPFGPAFFTGMILVIPLFIKQNIGLAFLAGILVWLMLSLIIDLWKKLPLRGHTALLGGIATGLAASAVAIHFWVGLDNYKYWTWTFATARRSPSAADMLSVYLDPLLPLWLILFGLGVLFLWLNKTGQRLASIIATLLMAIPFAWPAVYLLLDPDPSERAERLANLWPIVLIASLVLSLLTVRRITGFKRFLPFLLFCTAHGVFLSQQLWGSTYGIWPLFVVMVATILFSINELTDRVFGNWLVVLGTTISISLTIAGGFYVYSNERLDYVELEDGDIAYSSLPQLKGLAIRGSYLPDFEELVQYTNENIPIEDGILTLPGEDLFYYTTGRHPKFPALLFDVTNNPYSPEEIANIARERDIKWLIVKNDLQIEADQMIDDKKRIFETLKPDFKHIESLNNYEIYRRKQPGETDEDDEDDNDDDSDDSDN
jgi:hypothetical protein